MIPHASYALETNTTCTFEQAAQMVERGSPTQLWSCLTAEPGLLASVGADSRTLFQVAAASASDPSTILTLSAFNAQEVSEDDQRSLLQIAATENPALVVLLTLQAIGRTSDSDDNLAAVLPSNRPFIRNEENATLSANRRPARAREATDCSSFLTEDFIAEAPPAALSFCQGRADPVARGPGGNTALHIAMRIAAEPATVEALLAAVPGEDLASYLSARNDERRTALQVGARFARDPRSIASLLNWGADPNEISDRQPVRLSRDRGVSALTEAMRNRDLNARFTIVALLLAAGADTALHVPYRGTPEMEGGQTPLHFAASLDGDPSLLFLLLETEYQRASFTRRVARRGTAWVRRQAERFREDEAEAAMSHRVENRNDESGRNALDYLMRPVVYIRAVELALAYGLNPDQQDRHGSTPLMRYARSGTDPDLLLLLLSFSQDPCITMNDGVSALGFARANESFQAQDRSGEVQTPTDYLRRECGE